MKKIIAGLFVTILLATGLVAFSTSASTAGGVAGARAPYPGSIDTNCEADALNSPRAGRPAKVRFRAGSDGNGAPHGVVTFKYKKRSNGNTVRTFTEQYQGPEWQRYAFSGIPKGSYHVDVHFNTKPADSVYKNCDTGFNQKVRPRR